jgi:hypothetical protein
MSNDAIYRVIVISFYKPFDTCKGTRKKAQIIGNQLRV